MSRPPQRIEDKALCSTARSNEKTEWPPLSFGRGINPRGKKRAPREKALKKVNEASMRRKRSEGIEECFSDGE